MQTGRASNSTTNPPQAPPTQRMGALRHRNFTLLWSSLVISNVGSWMQTVGQGWLVLQLTNSPLYLGLVSLAFAIPMTLLPPFGGAIADRIDKLRLVRITQTLYILNAGLLAGLTLARVVTVWEILSLSFTGALLLAVDNPTRQALLPSLVPRTDLMSAISLNSAVYSGAALFGPALGGFLLVYVGAGGLFLINALSYGVVLIATLLMRDVDSGPEKSSTGFWADVTEGLSFIVSNRLLLVLVGVSALSGLLGRSYSALLPVFARDVWHAGARGYGLLLSAPGAGALIGAFGLAAVREVRRKGLLLILSMLAFGVVLLLFAYSPLFLPALGLLLLAGVFTSIFGTTVATLIQLHSPGRLRGRAMSIYTITIIGIPSLGAMGTASVAEWLGARESVGLAAGLLALVSVGLLLWSKAIKQA